jgi:probable rRNA maturation factor
MIDADHSGIPLNTLALERFLRTAQQQVGLTGEVSVLITSSEEMRRLNCEFRDKNKPTDVLSFPTGQDGKLSKGMVGDIAISAEIARANADALGHPLESELKILLLHGLLHLAGYDHESDSGRMAKREQQLRAKLRLPTGLIERTASVKATKSDMDPAAPGGVFDGSLHKTKSKHPGGGARIHVKKRGSSVSSAIRSHSPRSNA